MQPLAILFMLAAFAVAFILFIVFVLVPVFRGIGWLVTNFFTAIGWFVSHIFEFIGGMIGDAVRLVGSMLALVVLALLVPLNVIIGRWSAAGHFSQAVKRETMVAGGCLYRLALRRPLKLFWLHGLVEGLEERVPEAVYGAPTSDNPGKRTGQFDGYTIVGSLRGGGSGGKLYVARPDATKQARLAGRPDRVVIKSFAVTEGSSLPQIVRESRALECAKQLGHVLEHGMNEHRFYYVMPFHPGDHLGIITRQRHAESDGRGLGARQLRETMGYLRDLLATLSLYHQGGFWHKDVKPENIIVHDGRAHLVDLGLITPLKSAMTLTTHGTEYFRDPEMVRQALRGVKVHQVNGVKFDIYAVGAVLYFVIENTFPAHGGLSRFNLRSPEALRWIVKRAMAEYHQRYDSAELMLADLEAVANAPDPYAFKPADLPSMRRGASEIDADEIATETDSPQVSEAAVASVIGASSPRLPLSPAAQSFEGGDRSGNGTRVRPELHREQPERRPLLRVLNWFTGQYAVDDPGSAVPLAERSTWMATSRAEGPAAARADGRRNRTRDPRRPAREQLLSARARLDRARQRISSRRHRFGPQDQPTLSVVAISVIIVAALIAGMLLLLPTRIDRLGEVMSSVRGTGVVTSPGNSAQAAATNSRDQGLPLLVIFDADDPDTIRSHEDWPGLREQFTERGYHLLQDVGPEQETLRDLLRQWREGSPGTVSGEMERIMADYDLYGFLQIKVLQSDVGRDVLQTLTIRSGAHEAPRRRWPQITGIGDPPAKPFLLLNDHPARYDHRVQNLVDQHLAAYRERDWTIVTDDEAEVRVRKALLPTGVAVSDPMPPRVEAVLDELELGGILYVYAPAGEASLHDRVAVIELRPSR